MPTQVFSLIFPEEASSEHCMGFYRLCLIDIFIQLFVLLQPVGQDKLRLCHFLLQCSQTEIYWHGAAKNRPDSRQRGQGCKYKPLDQQMLAG